jgi:predicted nucleotidyltransferase
VEARREEIEIVARHHECRLPIFGSVARETNGPFNDIGFLVELQTRPSRF